MKVLVVDDSNIILDRISTMIRELDDFSVAGLAHDTDEGKEMIAKLKPDVVITDIRMPGGGGMELLTYIKEKYSETNVIVITNYTYPQYKNKAYELGANYFLSKSEDLERLPNILDKYFSESKKVQE